MLIKMDATIIKAIAARYTDAAERCQAMLEVWMDPRGDVPRPPTWRVLLEALRASGKEELAMKIEQCRDSKSNVFDDTPEYLSTKAHLKRLCEEFLAELQSYQAESVAKPNVEEVRVAAPLKKPMSQPHGQAELQVEAEPAAHKEDTLPRFPGGF